MDGSPTGPSTDGTKEIAKGADKVLYQSGKYATLDGAWDMASQRNTGISAATGDVLLFLSADMYFSGLERLREVVDADQYKIIFCPTHEFWIDTKHLRLYSADTDALTVPSSLLQSLTIDTSYAPYCEENGKFQLDGASHNDRIIIPQITRYHLGWVRPFAKQVAKHVCHVRQHRWPELDKMLHGSERELEQWATRHVLGYASTPSIAFTGTLPSEMESHLNMRFDDGVKDALADFKRRHGFSPFKTQGEPDDEEL